MAWKSVEPMEERERFVIEALENKETFVGLCKRYGIKPKTGYKLMKRYREEGLKAIQFRSRRPIRNPSAISTDAILEIVALRNAHPRWGAKKLRILLQEVHRLEVPSIRSINRVLDRAGMLRKRRRRNKRPYYPEAIVKPKKPNDVWTVDFKGYWHTQDGQRCIPLTIRDEYSRYILDIGALGEGDTKSVQKRFESCFFKYGLPRYIRSDNGAPFCAYGAPGGLSRLSAWWIKLGILPNRINKGCPQQNGSHERMHLDMKKELQTTPARDLRLQQRVFDAWRREYNEVRPHESLQQKRPSKFYKKSARCYSSELAEFQYPDDFMLRKVGYRGEIFWKNQRYFISNALRRETVALEMNKDGSFTIWFRNFVVGRVKFRASPPCRGVNGTKTWNKPLPMSWH